jgi:hypothetical protein
MQSLTRNTCPRSHLGHANCASNVTKRRCNESGLPILENRLQIRRNLLGAIEIFRWIPSCRFKSHRSTLSQVPCLRYIRSLCLLVTACKQKDKLAVSLLQINPVPR